MRNIENICIELSEEELVNVEGGVLPVIAVGALLKGVGIGFGVVAAGVGLAAAAKELFS